MPKLKEMWVIHLYFIVPIKLKYESKQNVLTIWFKYLPTIFQLQGA
jgi:hypothetical protein